MSGRSGNERLALEQALLDAPEDLTGWAVYADHLQQRGDPWGERVSLGLAHGESAGERNRELLDALARYDREHAAVLLGEPLARLLDKPGFANVLVLERAFGLVLGARVGRTWIVREDSPSNRADREYAEQVLDALVSGPASRLLRSLTLGYCDRRKVYASLASSGRAAQLRRLALGWEQRSATGKVEGFAPLGELAPLLDRLPALRELALAGPTADFDHPGVERIELTIEPTDTSLLDTLADARVPNLRALELRRHPFADSPAAARASAGNSAERALAKLFGRLAGPGPLASLDQLELVGWSIEAGETPLLTQLARALPGARVHRLGLRACSGSLDILLREADVLAELDRIDVDRGPDDPRMHDALQRVYGERLAWPEPDA